MNIKKVSLLILVVLITSISFSFVSSYAEVTQKHKKVKVGYSANYGIINPNEDEEFPGYGYEYLQEISKYTGWEYEFVLGTWEEGIKRLETGEIDIFGPLQYSDKRAEAYTYPNCDAGTEYGAMYAKADNNLIYYEDFEAFDGMKVATMFSSYQNEEFEKYCKENNFEVEFVYFQDTVDIVNAVEKEAVDACICGSLLFADNLKIVGNYAANPFYFASTKGNVAIGEGIEMASKKIRLENSNFTNDLYDKYFHQSIEEKPDFTREETEYIKIHNEINVVFDPYSSPVEFYDNEVQSFRGINVSMFKYIEQKSGLKLNFVKTKSLEESIEYIKNGKAQLISSYRSDINNLQDSVKFTNSYMNLPMVMIGELNSGSDDDSFKIAMASGLGEFEEEIKSLYNGATVNTYDTVEDAIYAIKSNKATVGIVSSYLFDELVKNKSIRGFNLVSNVTMPISMKICVSNDCSDILVSILNKSIKKITQDEINTIVFSNTINKSSKLPFSIIIQEYAFPLTCCIGVIILLSMYLIINNNRSNEKRLQYIAFTDRITGLENWDKLEMEAPKLLVGKNNAYAFVYFDVDNFKLINDAYGYDQGTETLINIAKAIREEVKTGEFGVRISGDKFAMILKLIEEEELVNRLKNMFDKINESCRGTYNSFFTVSFSCGIYKISDFTMSINNASDKANIARRTVKQKHGTSFAMYDENIRKKLLEEKEIEDTMSASLINGEFVVYLQAKFNLTTNEISGAEALVRWQNPMRGLMPPNLFIPIFEKNGFIVNVDLFVLDTVCRNIKIWIDAGKSVVPVSVNLSRVHLSNPELVDTICNILNKYNVPYGLIELELTESAIYNNSDNLLAMMKRFKNLGFKLSMDDFGTGYSSLNLLKDMPIDILKLDKEFLSECIDTKRGKSIITDVVALANNINIAVLSEGVETKEQVDFLLKIGCNMVQGFYFAKPMPIFDFEKKFMTIN